MSKGIIKRIIGPVVDVQFEGQLPALYNALEVSLGKGKLIAEVQKHLGSNIVRAVAMGSTDGLGRGAAVKDTGGPISVPVGKETLGRMFNLLGAPIDGLPAVVTKEQWPIHRSA